MNPRRKGAETSRKPAVPVRLFSAPRASALRAAFLPVYKSRGAANNTPRSAACSAKISPRQRPHTRPAPRVCPQPSRPPRSSRPPRLAVPSVDSPVDPDVDHTARAHVLRRDQPGLHDRDTTTSPAACEAATSRSDVADVTVGHLLGQHSAIGCRRSRSHPPRRLGARAALRRARDQLRSPQRRHGAISVCPYNHVPDVRRSPPPRP